MHRSEEDGRWTLCAYNLAASFINCDQLGFICISLLPAVLFIESPRHCANSTVTRRLGLPFWW